MSAPRAPLRVAFYTFEARKASVVESSEAVLNRIDMSPLLILTGAHLLRERGQLTDATVEAMGKAMEGSGPVPPGLQDAARRAASVVVRVPFPHRDDPPPAAPCHLVVVMLPHDSRLASDTVLIFLEGAEREMHPRGRFEAHPRLIFATYASNYMSRLLDITSLPKTDAAPNVRGAITMKYDQATSRLVFRDRIEEDAATLKGAALTLAGALRDIVPGGASGPSAGAPRRPPPSGPRRAPYRLCYINIGVFLEKQAEQDMSDLTLAVGAMVQLHRGALRLADVNRLMDVLAEGPRAAYDGFPDLRFKTTADQARLITEAKQRRDATRVAAADLIGVAEAAVTGVNFPPDAPCDLFVGGRTIAGRGGVFDDDIAGHEYWIPRIRPQMSTKASIQVANLRGNGNTVAADSTNIAIGMDEDLQRQLRGRGLRFAFRVNGVVEFTGYPWGRGVDFSSQRPTFTRDRNLALAWRLATVLLMGGGEMPPGDRVPPVPTSNPPVGGDTYLSEADGAVTAAKLERIDALKDRIADAHHRRVAMERAEEEAERAHAAAVATRDALVRRLARQRQIRAQAEAREAEAMRALEEARAAQAAAEAALAASRRE